MLFSLDRDLQCINHGTTIEFGDLGILQALKLGVLSVMPNGTVQIFNKQNQNKTSVFTI